MKREVDIPHETQVAELLGTYLQVSAQSTPPSYCLGSVATAFSEHPTHLGANRRASPYDHLVKAQLDPQLDELNFGSTSH